MEEIIDMAKWNLSDSIHAPVTRNGGKMSQMHIQTWNDAVDACTAAAFAQVVEIESQAADGIPHVARLVVRALGQQYKQGDDRRVIDTLHSDDFPALK
jgi:hypothetical protein